MLATIYSVGCNEVGHLPEYPPVKVRTFKEAAAYLAESLDHQADAHFEVAANTKCGCIEEGSCQDARLLASDIEELVRLADGTDRPDDRDYMDPSGWQSYTIENSVYWIVPSHAKYLDCIACDNRAVGWVEARDVGRNPNELIPVCEEHAL